MNVSRLGGNDVALVQQFVGFLGRGTSKFEIRKDLAAVAATMVATFEVLEKKPDNMNYWDPKTEAYERASQLVGRYSNALSQAEPVHVVGRASMTPSLQETEIMNRLSAY
ncbi:hypothetical protein LTR20_010417 [Exophiala xenobiotica]|nr:hypothetical protein LTR40_006073 [Exophiala xenobiotica]KAK5378890.1 hypothetical protein LTS13_003782 [Exophiala xenobiotica]KAK5395351.1 hypothetical protein LTR79_007065 [Exophiala xenobiotica]KAK5407485.1 hypothetical protein LTR90_010068 [Exophiala xenobiotica]KAK5453908.1 hypothetical protein LTR20_010417 [Exophiala xenobiotica]